MSRLPEERIADRRIGFRNENERIHNTAVARELTGQLPFTCECADSRCSDLVLLSGDAYQAVRRHPRWFFNITGHEAPSVAAGAERVVAVVEDLTIVITVGRAGKLAFNASTSREPTTSADERDRYADERDRAADERDRAADVRERAADQRDRAGRGEMNQRGRSSAPPTRATDRFAWHIVDMRDIEPQSDRDTVQAVRVDLIQVDKQSRIVVELSRSASERGLGLDAYHAAEAYLDYESPPQLLIVESDGTAYPAD